MTRIERFISSEKKRLELDAMLKGNTLGEAVEILKDMHRPSRSNVRATDATRVVLAAETHDYQAGWHDCIRAMSALTIPKKDHTEKSLEPFDDEWVKKLMEKRGTPLREPTQRVDPKSKTKK